MNSRQYTDPRGALSQTLSGLYDFIPALRKQRVRGILEPPVAAAPQPDPNRFNPPESGGQGSWGGSENTGWGELGTPSNTELGLPTTIGPAQALGNVFGLVSNPIGLPMSLAMQQMGLKPSNMFSPDYQMMPAPVSSNTQPTGTFSGGGIPGANYGGFGLGNVSMGQNGFGYDGLGMSPGVVGMIGNLDGFGLADITGDLFGDDPMGAFGDYGSSSSSGGIGGLPAGDPVGVGDGYL